MLDFPNTPATGALFSAPNGARWHWDSAKWAPGPAPTTLAWSLTAHAGAYATTGSGVCPPTSGIDTTGADLLVVIGSSYGPPSDPAVHDSNSNTWIVGPYLNVGQAVNGMYWCRGGAVGPGHTFTWTGPYGAVEVLAFRGSASSPLDQSSTGSSGSANVQPGAITPTAPNSLIVTGVCGNTGLPTIDSGFTITDTAVGIGGTVMSGAGAYLVQPTAAAINPTWYLPGSVGSTATIMSFKGA